MWNCYGLGLYDFKKCSREGIAKLLGYYEKKQVAERRIEKFSM